MACDPATIVDQARCIETCIPPGMQMPVLISLFCQIITNGGTGGGGGVLWGHGNPNGVTDGTTTATTTQAYFDIDSGITYYHTGVGTSNTGWV